MWRLVRLILGLAILFVAALIFLKSLDYYQPDFGRGYLVGKEGYFHGIFKYGLYAHIISTPVLILLGTIQLFLRYEYRSPQLHRWIGRLYGGLILGIAAPGALIMAVYAYGGFWGKLSFFILGALWILVTGLAWYFARKGDLLRHQRFIIRSYILTISAVTLRIFSFLFIHYLDWYGPEMYATTAWLSWLPLLLIYEGILLTRRQ